MCQSCFNRILADVISVRYKARVVPHAFVREATLPDFVNESELPLRTKREIALDKLNGFLYADIPIKGKEKVEMVRHHHKIMNEKLSLRVVGPKHVNK